ncbi:MAG: polymer-forming cytoskeletal protein [Zetaproteobacteria bacterium]|nr:polymer-forming cytoskeletal protein [Zetaproteobacteria bacterium]
MIFSDKGSNKSGRRSGGVGDSGVTILTPGCHFKGKLHCRGASRIGGKIEGEVISEGLLIIEEEAEIKAKITADEAIVQGKVLGSLVSYKRVKLTETCVFQGDIQTPSLVVNDGAIFNGNSQMHTEPTEGLEAGKQSVSNQPVMGAVTESFDASECKIEDLDSTGHKMKDDEPHEVSLS